MRFYESAVLPCIELGCKQVAVPLADLKRALYARPCNTVFLTRGVNLAGIITHGDIARAISAGAAEVPINFDCIRIEGRRFMQARQIFKERSNVFEIPVIDASGGFEGICSRFDDLLYLEYRGVNWNSDRFMLDCLAKHHRINFVTPPAGDEARRRVTDMWMASFSDRGITCIEIAATDVAEAQAAGELTLVADEEMQRGIRTALEIIDGIEFKYDRVQTFKQFESNASYGAYGDIINDLAAAGVAVYNMYFTKDATTPGRKRLLDAFSAWSTNPDERQVGPHVPMQQAPAFFGEHFSPEYAEEVGSHVYGVEQNSIYTRLTDLESPYINIKGGERVTVGQPQEAERTVYFFGPCLMIGAYTEDAHTIESYLQAMLNDAGYSCKVVNCGCFETPYQEMIRITSTPMRPGDIVVLHVDNHPYENTVSIDLMDVLDENDVPNDWVLDLPMHVNYRVNELYAAELFKRMVADGALAAPVANDAPTMLARDLAVQRLYLDRVFNDFTPKPGERVGTVGMHGNPFTWGHRYLIETASKQVDRLFCLLIADDLGVFSYAERFAMTVEGTKDLENVRIVSGGPFQATRNIFREYFLKVAPTSIEESALADTLIYAEVIAKRLGIKYRFLGDERHNPKMDYFNKLMARTLADYGIEAVELPRFAVGDAPVSASAARAASDAGDAETLKSHVPPSTLAFFGED